MKANWNIPLFKIYFEEDDVEGVTESIRAGRNWAIGPNIEEFERRVASFVGTGYALAFNSGTSALHVAMLAHDIKRGDEVIVPSFSFVSTANSPLFVQAKPVFAEIEEESYGLDPEDVRRKITSKTKAIMPVHIGGRACHITELRELADEHGLVLIEDAAESLGANVNGKKVGSFGNSSMFSFCAPKIITTGEGGVLVTDQREAFERMKLARSHGRLETENYFESSAYLDYFDLGYNFRMSNITAALAISQMDKIDRIIEMRRKNAKYLSEKLSGMEELRLPLPGDAYFHIYQMYTIEVKEGKKARDALAKHLNDAGIMTKVYFEPIHLSYFYKHKLGYDDVLPVTEGVSSRVLTLPMYPELTEEEMDGISEAIRAFFKVAQ